MLTTSQSSVLSALQGKTIFPPPIWIMRQAGRHLSEYKELRKKAGSFLNLCYSPDLASEASMQPIQRYDLDAAILFSDILLLPHALGRKLSFEENGPKLEPLKIYEISDLNPQNLHTKLSPVYETIRILRKKLSKEKALIGFSGAPWTLATYMISGSNDKDHIKSRLFSIQHPKETIQLLDMLSQCISEFLIEQIRCGADAIKIFDSWAGVVEGQSFDQLCVQPVKKIVKNIKKLYPDVPVIGFPRGAGEQYHQYRKDTGVDVLALDWTLSLEFARLLQEQGPVQGNLDPLRLLAGGAALEKGISSILLELGKGPLLFNLGHGIMPETPTHHVTHMINLIRNA